jgi:hypothetical protein
MRTDIKSERECDEWAIVLLVAHFLFLSLFDFSDLHHAVHSDPRAVDFNFICVHGSVGNHDLRVLNPVTGREREADREKDGQERG